jgi:hypothetical protein
MRQPASRVCVWGTGQLTGPDVMRKDDAGTRKNGSESNEQFVEVGEQQTLVHFLKSSFFYIARAPRVANDRCPPPRRTP